MLRYLRVPFDMWFFHHYWKVRWKFAFVLALQRDLRSKGGSR